VNWINAPASKLAELFNEILKQFIPLLYSFNIKNTTHIINDLKNIPLNENTRLASLDISNIYTNIPTTETRHIIEASLKTYMVHGKETQEILSGWYDIITQQNYFSHNNSIYEQHEGLAMGAHSSALLSEIFLQYQWILSICR
jgi:hypothetical protein